MFVDYAHFVVGLGFQRLDTVTLKLITGEFSEDGSPSSSVPMETSSALIPRPSDSGQRLAAPPRRNSSR